MDGFVFRVEGKVDNSSQTWIVIAKSFGRAVEMVQKSHKDQGEHCAIEYIEMIGPIDYVETTTL